jgi:hypothetical protein
MLDVNLIVADDWQQSKQTVAETIRKYKNEWPIGWVRVNRFEREPSDAFPVARLQEKN